MLTRVGKNPWISTFRRFASTAQPAAFADWSKRHDELSKKHPKLFSADFQKDQESFLSKNYTKDQLSKLHSDYDASRQAIDKATGENVFLAYDLDQLLASKPKPVNTVVQSKDAALAKLTKGSGFVSELLAAQKSPTKTVEEANLKMIKVADYADAIDHWRARLADDINDSSELPLPITDQELDQWVGNQYFHAPDDVRVQTGTFEEHREIEEAWMKGLDEKLVGLLKEREAKFDEKKFREYMDITNELFHPFKIDHYTFSNYAKALFRAALWDSQERLKSVEQGVRTVAALLGDKHDDDARICRIMYEDYPDSKFGGLAALQLKMTDPLFAAKLCDEARARLERVSFERAVLDVVRELEIPYILSEKKEVEVELEQSETNKAILERDIRLLDEQVAHYDLAVPSLEAVLDQVLAKRLWGKDPAKVKAAIVAYAGGKGSLDEVSAAVDAVLVPKGEKGQMTDEEIMTASVRYHNARYSDVSNWNFGDFMRECGRVRKPEFLLTARRMAKAKLDSLGCDSLVTNTLRLIIENDELECNRIPQIVGDFEEIMKQWRGEIDGTITSAQEMDDKTFGELKKAIETANPGKKITMSRVVDPGLQAGFIVKAGVQRFDFSLSAAVHEGRKAVGAF